MCAFASHTLFMYSMFWNTKLIAGKTNSELTYQQLLDRLIFLNNFVVVTALSETHVVSE